MPPAAPDRRPRPPVTVTVAFALVLASLAGSLAACTGPGRPAPRTIPAAPPPPRPVEEPVAPVADRVLPGPEGVTRLDATRAPAVEPGDPSVLHIMAVGDVMLGSDFAEGHGRLPPDEGASLLVEATPILSRADIAFGNLEGALLDGGTSRKCTRRQLRRKDCWAFRTPTRFGQHLAAAGFDVLSLANNHVVDFGPEGLESTMRVLDELGIKHAGKVGDVATLEVRGTRVAVVAFATSRSYLCETYLDVDRARAVIGEAAARADVVIVSFHGGKEGREYLRMGSADIDRALTHFARAAVEAGADLVVGHGPHVPRGMELYRGRLIAYSLGNFATYATFNVHGVAGLSTILDVRLAKDGSFLGGRLHGMRQQPPGGPRHDPTGEVFEIVRSLSAADFGVSAMSVSDQGELIVPDAVASPAATSGVRSQP